MNRNIPPLIALSLVLFSCREAPTTPPMKVGTFYDIAFATKPDGLSQTAFRVKSVGPGSWVQVEIYDNPAGLLALAMMGFASESGKNPQELERGKKTALAQVKAATKLKWINLQTAVMISESDPKKLGFLKDL